MAASRQWTEAWTGSHRPTDTGLRINHRPSGNVLIAGRTRTEWQDWPVIATCQTLGAAQYAAESHLSCKPSDIGWRHIWDADDRPTDTEYRIVYEGGYALRAGRTGRGRDAPAIETYQTLGAAPHAPEGFLCWRPVSRG
jgi:hypothetical protein